MMNDVAAGGLPPDESIAVIGMSGQFAESSDLDELWEHLIGKKDCISVVPADRWSLDNFYVADRRDALARGMSYSKWGGFIPGVAAIEAGLRINEAADGKQARALEEVLFTDAARGAIASSGYTEKGLNDDCKARVGVYVGMLSHRGTGVVGLTPSVLAMKASQAFDFGGPSMGIDVHSASSMTAIHLACKSLLHGGCDAAIAGGVFVLTPYAYKAICQLKLLSIQRESRVFSTDRDGLRMAEGVGAVLLKRLSRAIRDGDNILALIRATATSYVGRAETGLMPSPDRMAACISGVIRDSGVDPRTISYIEAASPGLPSDANEVLAASRAFGEYTQEKHFCTIGSVESNVGHASPASGVLQLLKVIMQMRHKYIVPSINVRTVDPGLGLQGSPFYLQQDVCAWERPRISVGNFIQEVPLRALVNSMGYGGFYVSAIVEEYGGDEFPFDPTDGRGTGR
jgi:acyl transferase domain-containing protein